MLLLQIKSQPVDAYESAAYKKNTIILQSSKHEETTLPYHKGVAI